MRQTSTWRSKLQSSLSRRVSWVRSKPWWMPCAQGNLPSELDGLLAVSITFWAGYWFNGSANSDSQPVWEMTETDSSIWLRRRNCSSGRPKRTHSSHSNVCLSNFTIIALVPETGITLE